ncbi:MAG: hypothetical protein ACREPF_02085, partial [Rhodanobacteraceae bacterium]
PERGDRDVRADDRLLFLQLLSAARERFYVSWIGRDPHTNQTLPPSAVVAELIDVVTQGYLLPASDENAEKTRDALLPQVEPLHPFAATLFGGNGQAPRSYRAEWIASARTPERSDGIAPFLGEGELPACADAADELDLDALKRFYRNPARGLLERTLSLRLPREQERDADLEPLQPDHPLLRYQLTTALLERGEADAAHQRDRLRAVGRLPPGALADAALVIARERARILESGARVFRADAAAGIIVGSIALACGIALAGRIDGAHTAGLLRAIPAGLNGKRAAEAWIDTLFAAAISGKPIGCRLLWLDGSGSKLHVEARDIAAVAPASALAELDALAREMRAGLRTPLPLLPQASWDALKRWRQKGKTGHDEFDALLRSGAGRTDDDGDFGGSGDFADPAVAMVWRGHDFTRQEALSEAWYATACRVFPELKPLPKSRSKRA